MRSNVKGILKGATTLALGLMFVLPTAVVAQTDRDRRERREERQERREQRREERRGRDWGEYGGWGGSQQLRQTALNAGHNHGNKERRNHQRQGERGNL